MRLKTPARALTVRPVADVHGAPGEGRPHASWARRAPVIALLVGAVAAVATATSARAGTAGDASNRPWTAPADSYAPGRVLVRFAEGASPGQRQALLRSAGARVVGHIPDIGTAVLSVPTGAEHHVVAALQKSRLTADAEVDGTAHITDITPNDPYWPNQWGAAAVKAPAAWSRTTGSSSIVIAVVDTGLTPGTSELSGRVVPGFNEITGSTDTADDNGHGTDVAGVAAAQGNNGVGVAGMCWACRVMPVKVADASGNATYSAISSGIIWATDHGARVVNASLGGTTVSSTLDNAVAYARNHGVVVVAAAGNSGCDCPTYPAASPGAIAVAAIDSTGTLYSYSNYGSWVDVAAPGTNYSEAGGGTYFPFGGTSSASPVVAGICGLLAAAAPTANPSSIETAVQSTTDPLRTTLLAAGRVNASSALDWLIGSTPTTTAVATASSTPTSSMSSSTTSAAPSSSGSAPTTSPTPARSASSPTSTSPSPSTTMVSVMQTGTLTNGAKSYMYTTSGGTVTATATSSTAAITVSIVVGKRVVASITGSAGVSVTSSVPGGSFSITVAPQVPKTKFTLVTSYNG